jgi:hypothetical protein
MYVPANVTERINASNLRISINTDYYLYDEADMLMDWEAVSMTSYELRIKLNWDESSLISAYSDLDSLKVELIETSLFVSTESS